MKNHSVLLDFPVLNSCGDIPVRSVVTSHHHIESACQSQIPVIPGISSGTEMYFVQKLSGTFYKTLSASSSTERSLLRLRLKK